ncbi:hypothetical protein D3C83_156310 [compost metagenome]
MLELEEWWQNGIPGGAQGKRDRLTRFYRRLTEAPGVGDSVVTATFSEKVRPIASVQERTRTERKEVSA